MYIFKDDAKFFIVDEGSTNGTFIKLRYRRLLENGDLFEIGNNLLMF